MLDVQPRAGDQVWARWPIGYDEKTGDLDRGQIFSLRGYDNDEKLIRLGYVLPVDEGRVAPKTCGLCGARFISGTFLNAHGEKKHAGARNGDIKSVHPTGPMSPEGISAGMIEGDDPELEQLAKTEPLHLENTLASLDGDADTPRKRAARQPKKKGRR